MRALVIGRAAGVWQEVEAARALADFDVTIVINAAGCDYPGRVDCWVTYHVELFEAWLARREARGYGGALSYWSAVNRATPKLPGITSVRAQTIHRVRCEGGASGLVAAVVAVEGLRAARTVLAGVPMDPELPHYDGDAPWREAAKHRGAWQRNLPRIDGRVKSMSGWTRELLGAPTAEWLVC